MLAVGGEVFGLPRAGPAGTVGSGSVVTKPSVAAEGITTLYHGSDVGSAATIVAKGINKEAARALGGGDVFWATTQKDIATLFAQANPKGGVPAVVSLKIPTSTLDGLVKSGAVAVDRTGAYMVKDWGKFNKAVIQRGVE